MKVGISIPPQFQQIWHARMFVFKKLWFLTTRTGEEIRRFNSQRGLENWFRSYCIRNGLPIVVPSSPPLDRGESIIRKIKNSQQNTERAKPKSQRTSVMQNNMPHFIKGRRSDFDPSRADIFLPRPVMPNGPIGFGHPERIKCKNGKHRNAFLSHPNGGGHAMYGSTLCYYMNNE